MAVSDSTSSISVDEASQSLKKDSASSTAASDYVDGSIAALTTASKTDIGGTCAEGAKQMPTACLEVDSAITNQLATAAVSLQYAQPVISSTTMRSAPAATVKKKKVRPRDKDFDGNPTYI